MSRTPLIIGISGKRGSGKDTVGSYLEQAAKAEGFDVILRRGYGDAVKEEAADFLSLNSRQAVLDFLDRHEQNRMLVDAIIDQVYYMQPETWYHKVGSFIGANRYHTWLGRRDEILARMHDRKNKEQFRMLMQWWGTEYRRAQDDEYWLKKLWNWASSAFQIHEGKWILLFVPDDRFPNEQAHLEHTLGAYTVRVDRPSVDTGDTHPSECALDSYRTFHARILNDGINLAELGRISFGIMAKACMWKYGNESSSPK